MRYSIRISILTLTLIALGAGLFSYQQTRADGNKPSGIGPVTCTPPPPGMVGWWPGEGNADDIRGENNSDLNGNGFTPGKVGYAFSSPNSSGITIPDAPNLNQQTLTIDAWVTASTFSCTGCEAFIAAKSGTDGQSGYELGIFPDGRVDFLFNGGAGGARLNSSNSIAGGAFHHVAGTYDGTTMKLFIDGTLAVQTTVSPTINYPAGQPLIIGSRGLQSGSTHLYPGIIDEVALYSRALDVAEIQAIVGADSAGKCRPRCTPPPSGMVSWWDGDDNPFDRQSTNHGTFENAPAPAYEDGKVSRAFSFDGFSSYVDLNNYAGLKLSNAITIDAWVKPTSANNTFGPKKGGEPKPSQVGALQGILTKWGPVAQPSPSPSPSPSSSPSASPTPSPTNGPSYGLWLEETIEGFTLRGAINTGSVDTLTGGTIPADVFSHVVMTFDSESGLFALYVNGVQVASKNNPLQMTVTDAPVRIGCETVEPARRSTPSSV